MHNKKIFLLASLAWVVCLFSCKKDQRPSWDTDVLVPLVKSKLTINNLLADSVLQENPDNSLVLVYNYSLSSFNSDSLFEIPDTTIHNIYPAPITYTVAPGGQIVPALSNPVLYKLADAQLTQVVLRSGKMELTISSQVKGMVDFTYTLPKVKDPFGNAFDTTVTVPAATASSDGIYSGAFDLSGYDIDLTGPTGIAVNTMITSYSAVLSPNNTGSATIAAQEKVDISNKFIGIVPQYAKGYFGQSVSDVGPDTADFTMFNHLVDGTLDLEDIQIGLSIENSIGADARIIINDLASININKSNTVHLVNSSIGSPLNINRGMDNAGVVTPTTYSVSLTPSNSNIKAFLENLPNRLAYQLSLEVNPLGNVSGGNDFVYYGKLMKTDLNMTIPLSMVANDLTLVDTVDFDSHGNLGNVNSGALYLHADNGFPFNAEVQLYLLDADLNIVDSMVSAPNTIAAPQLDGFNICAGKKLSVLEFPMDAAKMELIRNTAKIKLQIKFNTAEAPEYVKLYSFYEMDIKLVGDFNYTFGK